jgi:hypothetical protein
MKKIIPITLALLFVCFASTAMADKGGNRSTKDGYTSKGARIERHLDAKGDRIEQRFDRRADRAAEQGKYRQAYRFQKKGDQINRHLDRKGARIHRHFEHHNNYRDKHPRHHGYPHVNYPVHDQRHNGEYFSMVIQEPGLLFGLVVHN